MPRLVTTPEFVVVKIDDDYGIAATTKSRYGVTVVERPIRLDGGDAMDAIFICKTLNKAISKPVSTEALLDQNKEELLKILGQENEGFVQAIKRGREIAHQAGSDDSLLTVKNYVDQLKRKKR